MLLSIHQFASVSSLSLVSILVSSLVEIKQLTPTITAGNVHFSSQIAEDSDYLKDI